VRPDPANRIAPQLGVRPGSGLVNLSHVGALIGGLEGPCLRGAAPSRSRLQSGIANVSGLVMIQLELSGVNALRGEYSR
jgi:hypothetical protein